MEFFTLNIFPAGGLSSSVITCVWVGVWVIVFLNLRFGTCLTGLVVPGYLIPLIIVRPISAGVVVLEAFITYFLAYLLANKGLRWLNLSEMFGRDRFFALMLISVIVRITCDGLLLPGLGEWLGSHDIHFDYRNNLHSFGLIIITLIANQMWNGGFRYGAVNLFFYLIITFFLVRYVLMPFTNFNLSTLAYMYEGLASSILASPKAYIILLTSAFIASRMNLNYGWDFNGILIPSLLALQWYNPGKLAATIVEALVIYCMAIVLLRIPLIRQWNLEGARQVLFFFNISFLYKIILGYTLIHFFPKVKITDYYGFGYLLATLIAIKMFQKDIMARITRATLQTSLYAVVVASIFGYALQFIPSPTTLKIDEKSLETSVIRLNEINIIEHINTLRSELYVAEEQSDSHQALPQELNNFDFALEKIKHHIEFGDLKSLLNAGQILSGLGYELQLVNQKYLVLRSLEPERGWGLYVINLKPSKNILLEVPAAIDEPSAMDAATWLFYAQEYSGLAITGMSSNRNIDKSSDVMLNPQTFFHHFHRSFADQNTIQIRSYTRSIARSLFGIRQARSEIQDITQKPTLWVKHKLPQDFSLTNLKSLIGEYDLKWQAPDNTNWQRTDTISGFAELYLNKHAVRSLLGRSAVQNNLSARYEDRRIDGYLQSWLIDNKQAIARSQSNSYVPAKTYELLFVDQAILTPMLRLIDTDLKDGWQESAKANVEQLASMANTIGYELIHYHHKKTRQDYLIFSEKSLDRPQRFWGTYVFRLGQANEFYVEIPRPLYEVNSLNFGVSLFEKLNAKVLLISGSHPYANRDNSSNLTQISNKNSLFNLVHQVVLRESEDRYGIVVQTRAFNSTTITKADVLVAQVPNSLPENLLSLTDRLNESLQSSGMTWEFVAGAASTRGYDVVINAQVKYLDMTVNKAFTNLWISPYTRQQFRSQRENRQQHAKFRALGIERHDAPLHQWLATHYDNVSALEEAKLLKIQNHINSFIQNGNINALENLLDQFPKLNYQYIIDDHTEQAFIVTLNANNDFLLAANINPMSGETVTLSDPGKSDKYVSHFVETHARWLLGSVQQ